MAGKKWNYLVAGLAFIMAFNSCSNKKSGSVKEEHQYNGYYSGEYLSRIAFPVGGIGAGMFCIEGTGAVSHMSVRNHPDIYNEPCMFAAISVKGVENGTKVIEGQVPKWKYFGQPGSGNGSSGASYGLPRFQNSRFIARFPFAMIELYDNDLPLDVRIKAWSPFIPTDADNSSLPVGALEYFFVNRGKSKIEAVFSYNSKNFMQQSGGKARIRPIGGGFILSEEGTKESPEKKGDFAIFTNETGTIVDNCWFRGGWWDPLTMTWNIIMKGGTRNTPSVETDAPGASLYVPFTLNPGETKTIKLLMAWYVPNTNMKFGQDSGEPEKECTDPKCTCHDPFYKPWYSGKFSEINEVAEYWKTNYSDLLRKSELFSNSFYKTTLPPEVIEAIAANLTILKSPTVLRQTDGKLWSFEGCGDNSGCCSGSCTHVWNYAQAIPHLFPKLERTLRETEFFPSQDKEGHQTFRAALPIRPVATTFYAAADGQLGGIMKVYRDWRICGDSEWLKKMYPKVVESIDYSIKTWDPRLTGTLEEPHHNTYDIEFWGPDGMCTSFYLGALKAVSEMGRFLGMDISKYEELYLKGKHFIESDLFNGEYFIQKIKWAGLNAKDPVAASKGSWSSDYSSEEAMKLLQQEGPKYQYGTGCLSDGILGDWIGEVCGLKNVVDSSKVMSHLNSVYRYNFRKDLSDYSNPQRPSYALGNEGGLLLCTWPKGGRLSLPFVYSDEVWTGIEYQLACHLMMMGETEKGLEIVRTARDRYDGRIRNPFDEYECGHWYARAMSSYGMLQGLTGVRYDAVDQILYISKNAGDFTSFISTATGFGNAGMKQGKPFLDVVYGDITIKKYIVR